MRDHHRPAGPARDGAGTSCGAASTRRRPAATRPRRRATARAAGSRHPHGAAGFSTPGRLAGASARHEPPDAGASAVPGRDPA